MLRVVLCNCSPEQAPVLARQLVEERLAACVNVIPAVTSIYRWDGKVVEDQESTLVIKTTAERYDALKRRIQELHSYEVPEIVAFDSVDVLQSYQQWAHEQVLAKS